MGVNATGTFGGSQVERRRREDRGAVGGEGVESGEGLFCSTVELKTVLGALQMKMTATCGIQKFR